MMKLKYYILWLFVIWLSFISFTNAWYTRQIWVYGYNPYNQTLDITMLNKWQMLTQNLWDTRKILFLSNNTFFFWGYNWIPYIATINWNKQWFATQYFNCPELQWNETVVHWAGSNSILWNCPSSVITSWSINVFSNFLNSLTNNDYFFFNQWSWYPVQNYFCISSSQFHSSLCFNWDYVDTNTSYWFTNQWWDSIDSSFLYNPPSYNQWWSSSWNQNSDIIYTYSWLILTNSWMYQGLLDMWFYKDLCYWDYNSWSVIDSSLWVNQFFWWDCEDWQSYCGMDLLEVYDLTTSSSSLTRTYDSWFKNYYNLFKLSYEKDNYTNWNWRYIALWKLMFKIYNNDFNSNFNWSDYYTFCKMTKDIKDWNFNWWSIYNETTYPLKDNTISHIESVRNWDYEKWQFVLSWTDIDNWNTLFDMFNNLYTRAKDTFKPSSSHSNDSWILPSYIVFGFLLMVLLYWLKR